MDGVFEVIFDGRIMPGRDPHEVKAQVGRLFKASPEVIERLFSGNAISIKKDLDYAAALRYVSVMKEAGALARLKQQEGAVAPVKKGSETWTLAPAGETLGGLKSAPPIPRQVDLSQYTLAPVGADVGEKRELTAVDVGDLSEFSIAEVGATLGTPREYIPLPEPDISDLSIAEVGATLVEPSDKPAANVEVPDFGLAEVGATLDTEKKAPPPPPPNTDHLKLG
ncbi:hypothetical protein [Permianibacter aggregans]|uniref:Uncharacterized protein n=1 Tax=Permianibacter aggregans TaxID=1510150 RepID=A0A4R6UUJ2_9GAMM|nr:hypothetical protein [Permianibacter aggregans]QGX40412.1 hypothetical protein E2H98_12325 [Permianibacter aggregans]TDQ49453.1 hypothetical protein EV696_104158 [Permianibacter aggregans]